MGEDVGETKDVDVVFVNTDGEEDRARAGARAGKVGLGKATHYGFADDFVEKLYFEADTGWRGELPFTALVAPDGGGDDGDGRDGRSACREVAREAARGSKARRLAKLKAAVTCRAGLPQHVARLAIHESATATKRKSERRLT